MDDFSFPNIRTGEDNLDCNLPLWFSSPYRRSFSSADTLKRSALSDDEEKMDMLWEDFSEVSRELKKRSKEYSQAKAAAAAAAGCLLPRHRRPSLVVMLKLLKKVFLVQKNPPAKRASSICKT